MEFSEKKFYTIGFFVLSLCIVLLYLTLGKVEIVGNKEVLTTKDETPDYYSDILEPNGGNPANNQSDILPPLPLNLQKPLSDPPAVVKAVYVTSASASSKSYLAYLDNLFAATQINAVVIDLKSFSGVITYQTRAEKAREYNNFEQWFDVNRLIEHFHSQGVYVIARLNVFNDSALAEDRPDLAIYNKAAIKDPLNPVLWEENKGQYWLDPASNEVWDYNIEIAKDALLHGFDEVNFDYIRFPSNGDLESAGFPKWDQTVPRRQVIKNFFKKIREAIPNGRISADIFGQTTVITEGDMGVGQVLEDAFEYFDYVSPMVYPSHYTKGFLGYETPSEYPYEVVKNAMDAAKARLISYESTAENKNETNPAPEQVRYGARIRPWLQDFTLTVKYNASKVKSEIQAVGDSLGQDFNGFMLWNPSNIYTDDSVSLSGFYPN